MDSILLESSPFHNPRLNLSDQNKQQKIYELVKDFILPVSKLRKLIDIFIEEMRLGLEANPSRKSVFYMMNTFVTDQSDGTEQGDFLSMDLGSTNLRIYLIRLKPGSPPVIHSQPYDVSYRHRNGTGEQLFDFLADCLKDFIERYPELSGKRLPFGFTFSFGCTQKALDSSILNIFCISTNIPDALGKDPVQLFRKAINKKELNIDVMAVLSDPTSTLAYGMYIKPDTKIGFILGSGANTCYLERVDRIGKLDQVKTFGKKVDSVLIMIESCAFGDDGAIDFAKTEWDLKIDQESIYPKSNSFEKMIGGAFIGDLVRRVLLCLAQNNVLLNGIFSDQLKQNDSICGADVSSVEGLTTDEPVVALLNRLGYSMDQISSDDIAIVRYVCALVSVRNAQLCAVNLAAVAQHIGDPFVRVAVDGSAFIKHPKMNTLITDFIAQLIPNQKVELFIADQGSGIGSGLVAAVAHKLKQK